MYLSIINIAGYEALYAYCKKFYPNKSIAKNIVHLIHAITCILLIYFDNISIMVINTQAFYLYDIVCLLYDGRSLWNKFPYIVHHIMSVYILQFIDDSMIGQHVITTLLMFEISNIPLYIYYHINKISYSDLTRLIMLTIELIVYVGIRIIWFNYYIYNNFDTIETSSMIIQSIFVLISIMNSVWTCKLLLAYIRLCVVYFMFVH